MANAQFTLDLAVDRDDGDAAYKTMIEDIRRRLTAEWIAGVRVLTPQVPGRQQFFDVNLSYKNKPDEPTHTVRARFRTDNLYMVGYFTNPNTWHGLEGGENYSDLTSNARMRLENISLSAGDIGSAITILGSGVTHPGQKARATLTLIFAMSEASRFRDISDLVVDSWWTGSSLGLTNANRAVKWSKLCRAVQDTEIKKYAFDFDGESSGITDFKSATRSLGIMLKTE
ncbi:ribosome-inactivating protein [Dichotomopilus funicola]|uniref:rRNA N-glycosylase n=1 Tax=Dichotomopilus funicola TaxID=1934379 RepID=A0AAN6UVK2_9PEZI|nr:ribosome-inactivating protein [Dichotomopilus funicola]